MTLASRYRRPSSLIERFFEDPFGYRLNRGPWPRFERQGLPINVRDKEEEVVLEAAVPGVDQEDLSVTLDEGQGLITIEYEQAAATEDENYVIQERRLSRARRSIQLNANLDYSEVSPEYKDGILTITIPKTEVRKAKRLEIK